MVQYTLEDFIENPDPIVEGVKGPKMIRMYSVLKLYPVDSNRSQRQ